MKPKHTRFLRLTRLTCRSRRREEAEIERACSPNPPNPPPHVGGYNFGRITFSAASGFIAALLLAAASPVALAQPDTDVAEEEPGVAARPAGPGTPKGPAKPAPKPLGATQPRQAEAPARVGERADRDVYKTFGLAYGDNEFNPLIPRTGAPVLVIPKDAGQAAKGATEAEQEDWQIMERILQKAVNQPDDSKRAMGIAVRVPFSGMGGPRNVYLEGYGAVFFLDVGYPLLPPPSVKEDAQPKDNNRAEWDEAKRELNRPAEPFVFNWNDSGGPRPPREDYSAEKVEELKKNVLQALKNAAHIKALKSDETITVIVAGAAPAGKAKIKGKPWLDSNPNPPNPPSQRANEENKVARLLVRAKKSDAESFLKDKLSLEDFRRKATVFIY